MTEKKTPEEIDEIRQVYRIVAFHALMSRGLLLNPESIRQDADIYAEEMVKDL